MLSGMKSTLLPVVALVGMVSAHSQIIAAVGDSGVSTGFKVDAALARNCTGINPCQQDATIIRDAEIKANTVNQCGRTELAGNIDVGENTENAIAGGAITQVSKGSQLTVTIHQVNADGAGPYVCDIDMTSNTNSNVQNLTVTNNVPGANGLSQNKEADFNMTLTMPSNLACTGASTGNVCTVRCRNNALAGPFGGCFAVMQTDVTPSKNNAATISTAQKLDDINAQVLQNNADLPDAVQANKNAGLDENLKAAASVSQLLGISIVSSAAPTQTPTVVNANVNAAATTTAASSSDFGGHHHHHNKRAEQGLRWAKRLTGGLHM